jgi:hypothetical protein
VEPGIDVQITDLPGEFAAGGQPGTITVVASTNVQRPCQKVRWSMLMQVQGLERRQVSVDRIEDNGSFPVSEQANQDTTRFTDNQFDPGELCPGRTVTARYRVAVGSDATAGRLTFQVEAFDRNQNLLQQATANSQVTSELPGAEATPPADDASPPAEQDGSGAANGDASAPPAGGAGPSGPGNVAAVPAASGSTPNLLGVGLIVGAVLIFLGVGLLLRLRMRKPPAPAHGPRSRGYDPTRHYSSV